MNTINVLSEIVNNKNLSFGFLVLVMARFIWVARYFFKSKLQELIGHKDLAAASRAKSRALCKAHATPFIRAWQSVRHAHHHAFPKSLSQTGAIRKDLSRVTTARAPRRAGRQGGQKKTTSGGSDDGGDGEPPHRLEPLLNYEDFGRVARLAPGTVKNLYCRSPERLPPAIRLPGHRGPLWHPHDVLQWLEDHRVTPVTPPTVPAATKGKRGRPRIAAQGKECVA